MNAIAHIDTEALIREAARYLAAVDVFRAERCEPTWRPELDPRDPLLPRAPRSPRQGSRSSGASRRQA
jgi:hypothetical protein